MMRGDELANRRLQLRDAAMDAAPELFVRELGEPTLDQVQPGPIGRREVHVKARALGLPVPDQGRLVRPVVIYDQLDVEVPRCGGINRVEKLSKFDREMPLMKLSDQLTRVDVERRKQRGRAMASVVVRAPLDLSGTYRQHGLRAIQRLNLGFFV